MNFLRHIFTVTLIVLITNLVFAQEDMKNQKTAFPDYTSISTKSLDRGAKNYLAALDRDNLGAVESAITNIMIMKLYFPDRDYSDFITQLSNLSTEGETKQVRYMAYIACNYLKHPERYNWIKKEKFKLTKNFFTVFTEKLSQQLENTEDSLLVFSE